MTSAYRIENGAVVIEPPSALPPFAAFAVSYPSDRVPTLVWGEGAHLPDAAGRTRRGAFAQGRAAAHAALRAVGLDHGPIPIGPTREPLWPQGARGAIAHAGGFGVALVAPTEQTDGVGVDLEERRDVAELWERVPRPEERRWLADLEPGERDAALLALFSAKESVYKAFFPRIGSYFGFEQALLTPAANGFVGRLVRGLDDEYPWERQFAITCGWFGDLVLTTIVLPKTAHRPRSRSAARPIPPGNGFERPI